MATIPDSVKAQLDADWAVGTGGVEPTYYVEEDFRINPPLGQDAVWILSSTLDTDPVPFNDTFVTEKHVLEMVVNTLTSEDRLKELGDEVVRILNATAITDITYQRLKRRKITSGVEAGIFNYQEVITYDLQQQMKSSAAAYGAGAGTNLDDLLMYGSAHAAWVPCSYSGYSGGSNDKFRVDSSTASLENVDGTDGDLRFDVPLPTTKGSLKLYVTGTRVIVTDADAAAYVNSTLLLGYTQTGATTLNTDGTNYDSQAVWDDTFAAVDCSSYNGILVWLAVVVDALDELNIFGVQAQCYYAT